MNLRPFELEAYFSRYEFDSPHLLCCSDAETWSVKELLEMADNESFSLWKNLKLGYTETKGLPLLRKEIAHTYEDLNFNHIYLFNGAEEAIYCSLCTLITPKDHCIIVTPCYQSLKEIPYALGASVTEIPLKEEEEWKLNLSSIQAAFQPHTKCVIINFPHNPTGQVIEPQHLRDLINFLRLKDCYLFSDEAYWGLGKPDKGWASPVAGLYEKGLSIGVMSKAYGLAGLRVGWIACQDTDLLNQIGLHKHYTSICNSAPSEILSLIALRNKKTLLKRNNQILAYNLGILEKFFCAYPHLFSWVKSQGGCVGWVKYKGKGSLETFIDQVRKKRGVLLLPGSVYQEKEPYFRIGFGRKNMPQALEALESIL